MKKKKEKNPKFKKIKNVILIVLAIYIVINRIYGFFIAKETSNDNLISPVTEEYEFVTISKCMSKYMDAINSKDANNIISIYSDDYKTENNITTENVLNLNNLSNIVSFKIDKLYRDNTKYYAFVTFYNQLDNSNIEKSNFEFTIHFYKNNTFAIKPQIQENLIQGD